MSGEATEVHFDELVRAEHDFIAMRRDDPHFARDRITGLALSGGGIRSATFCLGFLQTLSARGLIPRIDYLSTVSGGSYAGSFFGSLFVEPEWRGDGSPGKDRPAFDRTHPLQSKLGLEAIRRVRDMGRYLTPAGTSDAFFGGAVVSRNWVAVQFVIGMAALLLFWLMHGVDDYWREQSAELLSPTLDGLSLTLLGIDEVVGTGERATLLPFPLTPTLERVALLLLGATLACGNAYWLTRRDTIPVSRVWRVTLNAVFWFFLSVFVFTTSAWWRIRLFGDWTPPAGYVTGFITYVTGLAMALIVVAEWKRGKFQHARGSGDPDKQNLIAAEDKVRSLLSRWMAAMLMLTLVFTALGVIDYAGLGAVASLTAIGEWFFGLTEGFSIADAWPVLVALLPPFLSYFASRGLKNRKPGDEEGSQARRWGPTLTVVTGGITLVLWLILWSAVATAVDAELKRLALPNAWWVVCGALVLINLGASVSFSFINLSSLSTFYAARLRRAYIGASSYGEVETSVSKDDPQDTIRIHDYYTAGIRNGAPLHLINVTVAETVADGSNLVARDRKGKPMHLSPAGIAYEDKQPGTAVARLHDAGSGVEELPLANWVAISGAAVSAAIGAGTSLGTSILATMANVRLGYWWRGRAPRPCRWRWFAPWRQVFWADWKDTVQNYLFLELRGKFTGTARPRWYLTDGGHFDNTGVYPLLQRRVPFIIVCDNGADPGYRLDDVMRLVGRARTDLGVEITFLDEARLARLLGPRSPIAGAVGTLAALRKRGSPTEPGGPIAALATVDYGSSAGLLLLVKPKLAWSEPPEVLAYHSREEAFPQQTTGDQFFDEEQWEAYRRLGEIAGERLFPAKRPADMTGWLPYDPMDHDPGTLPRGGVRDQLEQWLRGD